MKIAVLIIRSLFGLGLVVFGLNKFLMFMPMPEPPEPMMAYMGGLMASGFTMPLVAVLEVVVGILLLANKFTALSLVVIFPIMVNALLAHIFLDPAGVGGAALFSVMNIFLFFAYKEKYSALLKPA